MLPVKIGCASLNQTPLDWGGNRLRLLAAVAKAHEEGCAFLLTPELSTIGYNAEDMLLSADAQRRAFLNACAVVDALDKLGSNMVVIVGLPVLHRNALFNCAAILQRSGIAGYVAKQNLAGDGIHYEPRWFEAWPENVRDLTSFEAWPENVRDVTSDGVPIGDLIFNINGIRFGFEICEDAWVASRPGARLVKRGVDIIFNPSASHFAFNKFKTRRAFVSEGSRAFNCIYAFTNLMGNEAGRAIYDGGSIIASLGEIVSLGKRFSYNDVTLTTATVDVERTRSKQAWTASFKPALGMRSDEVNLTFPLVKSNMQPQTVGGDAWETTLTGDAYKVEEFTRAAALGLFDYMRKSRSQGFVISLSGGVDSAVCALLVERMVAHGIESLGIAGFCEKSGIKALERFRTVLFSSNEDAVRTIVNSILTCAYQSTNNSGDLTLTAAQTVAENLGAQFHHFNVQGIVDAYVALTEQALGRSLSWERDDLALQNIQARVRAPSVWMLANIYNALLLTTSNRSEAAVGYATMDGDTCGGLAPIAGIDKAFLRYWLAVMQKNGRPWLETVTKMPPTAELRPPSASQTDESDLMPYPVLDAIEKAGIRDKMGPVDVFHIVKAKFDYSDRQMADWVARFFRLWSRNQWKRERYAPSFHYDDENLDPRSWCRFPILSGGFESEIEDLMTLVQEDCRVAS